jgi:hypothetical protein
MVFRLPLGVALALAGLALPAYGQGSLEWKFKEGDKFYVESLTKTTQSLEMKGKKTEYNSEQSMVLSFKVLRVDRNGAVLEETIEGVRVRTDDPTSSLAGRTANVLKGAAFRVTVTPAGKVTGFDGYVDWLKKIAAGSEAEATKLRFTLPESLFKEELATIFTVLPDGSASVGAKWQRPIDLPDSFRGDVSGVAEYTYKGKGDKGEEISVTAALKYTEPAKQEDRPVKLSNVKKDDMTGTVVFDAAAGRLVREDLSQREQGTVTVVLSEQQKATYNYKQKTDRTLRLLTTNPLQ